MFFNVIRTFEWVLLFVFTCLLIGCGGGGGGSSVGGAPSPVPTPSPTPTPTDDWPENLAQRAQITAIPTEITAANSLKNVYSFYHAVDLSSDLDEWAVYQRDRRRTNASYNCGISGTGTSVVSSDQKIQTETFQQCADEGEIYDGRRRFIFDLNLDGNVTVSIEFDNLEITYDNGNKRLINGVFEVEYYGDTDYPKWAQLNLIEDLSGVGQIKYQNVSFTYLSLSDIGSGTYRDTISTIDGLFEYVDSVTGSFDFFKDLAFATISGAESAQIYYRGLTGGSPYFEFDSEGEGDPDYAVQIYDLMSSIDYSGEPSLPQIAWAFNSDVQLDGNSLRPGEEILFSVIENFRNEDGSPLRFTAEISSIVCLSDSESGYDCADLEDPQVTLDQVTPAAFVVVSHEPNYNLSLTLSVSAQSLLRDELSESLSVDVTILVDADANGVPDLSE